jgi:hypothetical protein
MKEKLGGMKATCPNTSLGGLGVFVAELAADPVT